MIEERLRSLAKNKDVFDATVPDYSNALKRSGYSHQLTFEKPQDKKKTRNRRRRCIFYNPPYCQSTKTNIGRSFLRLVDKHFGPDHVFHRAFNRSTVKISYSCMPNAKTIIQSHNKRVLDKGNPNVSTIEKTCNCQKRNECPLDGACLTKNLIYEAKVTSESSEKFTSGRLDALLRADTAPTSTPLSLKVNAKPNSLNIFGLSKIVWSTTAFRGRS